MQGEPMDIGRAIQLMKLGGVMTSRTPSTYYLTYVPSYKYGNDELGLSEHIIHPERILKVEDNIANVWTPSQEDLLADDYVIVK
jgi:hypothetical protein